MVEALPELLKTLKRAAGMTVDQIASGKSGLARGIAKMRSGSQTVPKQELKEVQTGDKLKLHGPLAGLGPVLTKSFCAGKDASRWHFALLHRSTPSLDSITQLLLFAPFLNRAEALLH